MRAFGNSFSSVFCRPMMPLLTCLCIKFPCRSFPFVCRALPGIAFLAFLMGLPFVPESCAGEAAGNKRWNLAELKQAPKMRWLSQHGPIHSLLYAGEKFNEGETEVFAFYASPATLGEAKADAKFPGVVLIHGGGGTAFVPVPQPNSSARHG